MIQAFLEAMQMVALEIHHKLHTGDRQVKNDKNLAGIVHSFMALCLLLLKVRKFVSIMHDT